MNSVKQGKKVEPNKKHFTKEDVMTVKKETAKMKKVTTLAALAAALLLIAAGLILQPYSAEARGPFGTPRSADEIVQILTDRLALTDDQVEAIQPIIEEKVQRMNEVRELRGTDRQAARAEMQKLRWDTEQKLNEILTDEQIDKYLEYRQEQRGKAGIGKSRGGRMGKGFNRTPEEVIERMTYRLNLTEDQATDVEPIIEDSLEKKREVFEKYSSQGQSARQDMRDEMQAIGDETEAQLATILTDEQMETLRTIREEKRARMETRMNRPGQGRWR
jgi:predicted transcriptional regulator